MAWYVRCCDGETPRDRPPPHVGTARTHDVVDAAVPLVAALVVAAAVRYWRPDSQLPTWERFDGGVQQN